MFDYSGKVVAITGASSGLGKEFALQIDTIENDIDEIWLLARRRERLEYLAGQLNHPARVFAMDLLEEGCCEHEHCHCCEDGSEVCECDCEDDEEECCCHKK